MNDHYELCLPFVLSMVAFTLGTMLYFAGVSIDLSALFYLASFLMVINTIQLIVNTLGVLLVLDSLQLMIGFYFAALFTFRFPLLHDLTTRMIYPLIILALWSVVIAGIYSLRHHSK